MAEQATRAYLAEYLTGTDVILTAFEHRECADLARRVQGYLLEWGQLQPGETASLREGARVYGGDLIVARQNDNQLRAGEPGRMLANGDVLRVHAVGENDLTVSRLIRPDRAGGERIWSAPFTITRMYAQASCDLGYAQTWHTVEGQTVAVGIALANDQRTREGLYVAMSRGAFVGVVLDLVGDVGGGADRDWHAHALCVYLRCLAHRDSGPVLAHLRAASSPVIAGTVVSVRGTASVNYPSGPARPAQPLHGTLVVRMDSA